MPIKIVEQMIIASADWIDFLIFLIIAFNRMKYGNIEETRFQKNNPKIVFLGLSFMISHKQGLMVLRTLLEQEPEEHHIHHSGKLHNNM